jgi:hypothetical protein
VQLVTGDSTTGVAFRFAVTRADIEAALTRGRSTPSVRSSLLWATSIIVVGFLIRTNDAPSWMVATCFVLGVSLVALSLYVPSRAGWHWRRNRRVFQMCELRADETGIAAVEPAAEARADWSAFVRWEETPELFLLFRAPSYSVLIPKRAFESSSDQEVFRALLEAGIKDGQAETPKGSLPS